MKNNPPLVSIIIANWNGGKIFEKCLFSLTKLRYSKWELIIVDNGSNDGTAKLAADKKFEFKKVRVIQNKTNLGFAIANNQGYKVSRGKYLLLLNNDTLVDPDFIKILVEEMERYEDLAVVQPKIKIMDNPHYLDNAGSFLTRIGFLHHWGFMQKDGRGFNKSREIFAAKGACMLIRKNVVEKIGLFDEDFMSYFEESDFCWRVWLSGARVLYYPQTSILHKVGFTIKRLDVSNLNWHYYKNRISSLIKNLDFFNLLTILPIHIAISLGILLAFLLKGQFKNALIIWKALKWNVINLPKTLLKRKETQNLRKISDKIIFGKLSVPVDWKSFFKDFKRVEKDLKSN
jgi:GT2 family glycosyltransferase